MAWAGDITYIATDEGWAYLAVLLDLYSRRRLGDKCNERHGPRSAPARRRRARSPLRACRLVHHTDRGSPPRQRRLPPRTHVARDNPEHAEKVIAGTMPSLSASPRPYAPSSSTTNGTRRASKRRRRLAAASSFLERRAAPLASRLRQSDRIRIEGTSRGDCGIVTLSTGAGEDQPQTVHRPPDCRSPVIERRRRPVCAR